MPSSNSEPRNRFQVNPSDHADIILGKVCNENLADAQEIVRRTIDLDEERRPYWQSTLVCSRTVERAKREDFRVQRAKYIAVNVFLIFHIVVIGCWCAPIATPLIPLCKDLLRPYVLWSGLFQSWDTFAPTPKAANTFLEAVIVYQDGSRKTWTLPRMEQLSLTERYFKERYRKFADNLMRDETDALLPDAARYIARLNSTPAKPVKTVILIQEWSSIIPRSDGSYVFEPWKQHILLGYGVRPEDLK
jgi:hypothetical protein